MQILLRAARPRPRPRRCGWRRLPVPLRHCSSSSSSSGGGGNSSSDSTSSSGASSGGVYLSTPIYYVNGAPHVGTAYTSVACDVCARALRLDGRRVFFLTGTDEHGQKVQRAAVAAAAAAAAAGAERTISGMATAGSAASAGTVAVERGKVEEDTGHGNDLSQARMQAFVDGMAQPFHRLLEELCVEPSVFVRTTEPRHRAAVSKFWKRLSRTGDQGPWIYQDTYRGWYSVREERYVSEAERNLMVQQERSLLEYVEETAYFFRLSALKERLQRLMQERPDFVQPPQRRPDVAAVLDGLRDLCISRPVERVSWGIPVPDDPTQVIYVWFDALINYITALDYADSDETSGYSELMRQFWPADWHVVGKDILSFHAVYWPAMLIAAGLEPPRHIFAHGWWTTTSRRPEQEPQQGQQLLPEKMSKSRGNVVDPFDVIRTHGVDAFRYYLMTEMPFGHDGHFSESELHLKSTAALASTVGNLVHRTLKMLSTFCGGRVPDPGPTQLHEDAELLQTVLQELESMRRAVHRMELSAVCTAPIAAARAVNKYVAEQAPWLLRRKGELERMRAVLYTVAEATRRCSIMLQPVVPQGAARLLDQLRIPTSARSFSHIGDPRFVLQPDHAVQQPTIVFSSKTDAARG